MVEYEELISIDTNSDAVPMRAETSLSEDTATTNNSSSESAQTKNGVICRRSTDEAYIAQWGEDHWKKQYLDYGVKTIWNWDMNSGLKPCPVYLRHCVLASWNCGGGKEIGTVTLFMPDASSQEELGRGWLE